MTEKTSKSLSKSNHSGQLFEQQALEGDETYAINIDRIQYHPEKGWIVFEFLRCVSVKPQDSHPNRYWHLNRRKFVRLWRITQKLGGILYLVNYSDTPEWDGVLCIQVLDMDPDKGITREEKRFYSWEDFKKWFRELNQECSTDPEFRR